jgi:peptide deformylase
MAIRKVARLGHPVLRQVAGDIAPDMIHGDDVQRLITDLYDTMAEYEGVGLAAPQIFESLRAFVMYVPPDPDIGFPGIPPTAWVNPTITPEGEGKLVGWEGCLSIPDLRGKVIRHKTVLVSGYDHEGKQREARYEGFPSIVAQHENDHLDGAVFLDRMIDMKTLSFVKEYERYWLPRETED